MMFGETPPPPVYPEYPALLAAARSGPRFVDSSRLWEPQHIADRRGWDWATAVLGRPFTGLRYISHVEARLIKLADEADIDPPLPGWLIAERAETAARDRALEEQRAAARAQDVQAWADARAACPVELEVRQNTTAHVRRGGRENLGHAVPLVDAVSGLRKHQAGRALCETAARRLMQLGEPVDEPVTCVRCLDWCAKVRPSNA